MRYAKLYNKIELIDASLRLLWSLQLTEDRGMMRRTPLFQELLFTMINSSNPHNYGKDLRYKYRFAVRKEVGGCFLASCFWLAHSSDISFLSLTQKPGSLPPSQPNMHA